MPQYDEVIQHCPYYVVCVKETLRLWPSAPNIFPQLVGRDGMGLFAKFVPEGTGISCNPWIVHRDPRVYGEMPRNSGQKDGLGMRSRSRSITSTAWGLGMGQGFAWEGILYLWNCIRTATGKDE